MKGLLLNSLEKRQKEEAYDLVKRGVKHHLRSHVCWHVYGLLYRTDRDYDEAIKCYKNALKFDPENITVLRDLALLQIQMRDYAGFLETRQKLLELKSANRQHWVSFALAHHLNGNFEVAATILDTYEKTLDVTEEVSLNEAYERSELLLYKIQILEEGGKLEEALNLLDKSEADNKLKDTLGATEARGRLLLALGRESDAEAVFRKLIAINTENYKYHSGLCQSLGLLSADSKPSESTYLNLKQVYRQLQFDFPKSTAMKRIPLDFLMVTDNDFVSAADSYVKPMLRRGVPSLFSDMSSLYTHSDKVCALGELFERLESGVEDTERLPASDDAAADDDGNEEAIVWTRLYLAQHYNALGDSEKALKTIDRCIEQVPELLELHSARAKILEKAGDYAAAAEAADLARSLDVSDRYINCVAVKALFKSGSCAEAEGTAALFTRDGEQANNLFDMQASWYELSSGKAYMEAGDFGKALKRFHKIDSHFEDFVEDQFDFHQYCVRKGTLRAYTDLLRMEDKLKSHPVWAKAVSLAIACYLRLDDALTNRKLKEVEDEKNMSAEEARRQRQKKRREESRKDVAKTGSLDKQKDPDPDGGELAATEQPLEEASKLIRVLLQHAGDMVKSQLLGVEVYMRRGKLLLSFAALQKAIRLGGAEHPEVHYAILQVISFVENMKEVSLNASVTEVVKERVALLLKSATSLTEYHDSYAASMKAPSLPQSVAIAKGIALLTPSSKENAASTLAKCTQISGSTHKECVAVHKLLKHELKTDASADVWAARCAEVFTLSRYFSGSHVVPLVAQENGNGNGNGKCITEQMKSMAL